ncbi:MAG: ribonuclease HI family protein [Microgenomates group bacterium]
MQVSIYTDGGSRGNPGPSGFGVVIYDEHKKIIEKISQFVGVKTNNEAEYLALNEAISWVKHNYQKLDITQIEFYSDSQLLVRQMQGKYKVKAPTIVPLYRLAASTLFELKLNYSFHEILRELNSVADSLANQAMDNKK